MTETKAWEGDLLGRQVEGEYLRRYIDNLYKLGNRDDSSFVLNINSEWGQGKTWFLKNLAKELEQNPDLVKNPVVYFDAWKYDFTKDPLMSFVSVVCEELSNKFAGDRTAVERVLAVKNAAIKFIKPSLPVILAALVKHYIGVDFDKLGDTKNDNKNLESISDVVSEITRIASSEAMNSFIKEKNAIEEFTSTLKALVNKISFGNSKQGLQLPICIIIDELDRCRPTYAIELLEAVKHLFSVKGIVFILATDTQQLAHSIRSVYGEKFDSNRYLKRFFYSEYKLATPSLKKAADTLFENNNIQTKLYLLDAFKVYGLGGMFSLVCEFFKLCIRDQRQVYFDLEVIVLTSDIKRFDFIFIIFLVCLKHKFSDQYKIVENSKSSQDLKKFFYEKIKSFEIDELTLKDKHWDGNVGHAKEFRLREVFEAYLDVLSKVSNDPINESEIGFDWTRDVIRSIRDLMGPNKTSSYFDLVNQSGNIRAL